MLFSEYKNIKITLTNKIKNAKYQYFSEEITNSKTSLDKWSVLIHCYQKY